MCPFNGYAAYSSVMFELGLVEVMHGRFRLDAPIVAAHDSRSAMILLPALCHHHVLVADRLAYSESMMVA
jgi:hypothetical protein